MPADSLRSTLYAHVVTDTTRQAVDAGYGNRSNLESSPLFAEALLELG